MSSEHGAKKRRPEPFTTWRHLATDSLYVVLGIALCSTNGPGEHEAEAVVYFSMGRERLHYRALEEFMDGRFRPEGAAAASSPGRVRIQKKRGR